MGVINGIIGWLMDTYLVITISYILHNPPF